MNYKLSGLQPEKFFTYFEDISRIPRSTYNEKQVSDYIVAFAKDRGLNVFQDDLWNVIIEKPATPGYETHKGIILQGHMDMVCVSDEGVCHDFSKDPIDLVIDGDWIRANGTTLGADNGTAIAMMLMLLNDHDAPHPAIQCIFTASEEVGMDGASNLDPTMMKGDYLINLDGGGFQELLLSSAGTSNHTYRICRELHPVDDPLNKKAFRLVVDGMTSGHSGVLAHKCMGNAIQVLGSFLNSIAEEIPMELVYIRGGQKTNAIAKHAEAVILIPATHLSKALVLFERFPKILRQEYHHTDPEAFLTISPVQVPDQCCSDAACEKILAFLDLLFDGTYRFMTPEKSMAKTSCNIGILSDTETHLIAQCLMRSNSEYMHKELERKTHRMSAALGIEHTVSGRSPVWEFDDESTLVKKIVALYEQELGFTPKITMAHGGLEIGIIVGLAKSAGKKLEAINMGVESEGAHTTAERMRISAVSKTYEWLKKILISLD